MTTATSASNETVRPLHDRMPVIIPRSELDRWLLEGGAALLVRGDTPGMITSAGDQGPGEAQATA